MPPLSHAGVENNPASRPLTRRNAANETYRRSPEVAAQIGEWRARDHATLIAGAHSDYQSAAHIKDETLCYFIRECLHKNRTAEAQQLVEALLKRHAGTINRRTRSAVAASHREDCESEIISEFLAQLFDLESDRSDFAQVRFGLYFERLTIETIKKYRRLEAHERLAVDLRTDEEDEVDPLDKFSDEGIFSAEDRATILDALAHLAPELREVFILRHFEEWQTETDSPDEPSISRYFKVTPRTIRNRLREAEAQLQSWREGKRR